MKAALLFLAFLLISPTGWAATLISDHQAYSADGLDYNLPDGFEWSADGGETWTDIGFEVDAGGLLFRVFEPFDIASVGDWLVRSKNSYWGRVSAVVPFAWGGDGPLPAPGGLRVTP